MGLIKQAGQAIANAGKDLAGTVGGAALNSVSGVINQAMFKEYFTSGTMAGDTIMKRAEQVKNGTKNTKSDANIITTGSVIDVQPNQCMIIIENGKIADACTEPGQYVYDNTVAPSFFCGGDGVVDRFKQVAMEMYQQFQFGGQRHTTQRVYFINTGLLDKSMKWGVGNVVFRHTEIMANGRMMPLTIKLKGAGDVRIRMARPLDFYELYGAKYAGGDNSALITLDTLDEFFSHAKLKLTDVVGKAITVLGSTQQIRYDEISVHLDDLVATVNEKMADSDMGKAGFEFSDMAIKDGMLMPSDEDNQKISRLQEQAFVSTDVNMANYSIQQGMVGAMTEAGKNGGVSGLVGMGMMTGGGAGLGNMQYQNVPPQQMMPQQMAQPQMAAAVAPAAAPNPNAWTCSCGNVVNDGIFCPKCGSKKPEPQAAPAAGWTCPTCGKTNASDAGFCSGCGSKKPEAQAAPAEWTCSCGKTNVADAMFCSGCGSKKPAPALNIHKKVKKVIICDKCGWRSEDLEAHKFCPKCGDPVNEADIVVEE